MRLLGRPLSEVTEALLEELVTRGVVESQIVDYKQQLPGGSDDEKKALLADVVAMANSSGGVLLFGAETQRDANGKDTGVPVAFPGIAGLNFDQERLRIAGLLRDAVSPPITTQSIVQEIRLAAGTSVVAIGVSRSYLAPHMVTFKGINRFFRRAQGSNYSPAIPELRRMFLEQREWIQEAAAFRDSRIQIAEDEIVSPDGTLWPRIFLHILPLGRLDAMIDLRGRKDELSQEFPPLRHEGYSREYNSDGIRVFSGGNERPVSSYSQVLRCGGLEYLSFRLSAAQSAQNRAPFLFGDNIVQELGVAIPASLRKLTSLSLAEPPFAVFISLEHVIGAELLFDRMPSFSSVGHPLRRPHLRLPPFVIDEATSFTQATLFGSLDILWQSAGYNEVPRPLTV